MTYAGFWPRLLAIIVDTLVFAPLIAISFWALSASRNAGVWMYVSLGLLGPLYNIYFVGRWGQTIGKMAAKIRIVSLDGSRAGFVRAFYRHAVELSLTVATTALTVVGLLMVSDQEYDSLPFWAKMDLVNERTPSANRILDWISSGWVLSELVVLLFNERRRALHDYIAGTVVVHTEVDQESAIKSAISPALPDD